MASAFDRYHEEFALMIQQIQNIPNDGGLNKSSDLLQQCNDLLKQMSLEARSGDPNQKQQMLDKVNECKTQFRQVVQQSERQDLLASSNTRSSGASATTTLQKNESTMAVQNECLERAHRSIQETEQVALGITQELGNNRETMTRTHDRIQQVSSLTGLAKSIMDRMKR